MKQKKKIQKNKMKIIKKLCEKSIKMFAKTFFEHYLQDPTCSFHKDLYKIFIDMTHKRGQRVAIAASRGSAKSSIMTLICVIWCICFRREEFIVILGDTKENVGCHMEHIKTEFENNEKLREAFPEVFDAKPKKITSHEIVTATNIKIIGLGADQKIRGKRKGEYRPSLIIVDDLENEINTLTAEGRDKIHNWFTKAVLKAGNKDTNVIVLGTILHYDSLLAKLTDKTKMPGWEKHIYKAVISWATNQELWQKWSAILNFREDYMGKKGKETAYVFFRDNEERMMEGVKVIWPERESYYDLMVMREQDGEISFDSEKQNNPIDLKSCVYNPEEMYFYDEEFSSVYELVGKVNDGWKLYAACDPATGDQKHKDYSAIVVVIRDNVTGIMYVVYADIVKRKPDELIETILSYCQMHNFTKFGIESNGFQELIERELNRRSAERGIYANFKEIKNVGTSKNARILSLHPLVKAGLLRFSKKHKILLEQLRYFPKGRNDDGPDALEMAVRIAKDPGKVEVHIL